MFEPSHFYPPHITEILTSLETSETADLILLKYHCKTISDPILCKIYSYLNYPEISQIPSSLLKSLISDEYMADFPPIDSDIDLKPPEDFLAFHDCNTEQTFDLSKEDLFDSKSFNSYHSEETTATPMKVSTNPLKTTNRSRNGLKVLSWKVKEIVEQLGCSTYQEVADYLVKDGEEWVVKDEKNIRRRVYDALNVLIAVGVLTKVNKKVRAVRQATENTTNKVRKLKEASEKYLMIKGLIERNKCMKKGFQNLYLPFDLVVVPKGNQVPVKIVTNVYKNNVVVKLDHKFSIFGGDEILKHMDIEYNLAWLPKEVNSIINHSKITQKLD